MATLAPWEKELLEFVEIPSITGDEAAAGQFLTHLLQHHFRDNSISTFEVAPGRNNIYCHIPNDSEELPIILTSHFDTVPGDVSVGYNDAYLTGRGTCDAKGQIIAQIWAAKRLVESGIRGLALCFVVGEETDAIGARALIKHLPKSKYLLNGEPTGNLFVSKGWGVLDAKVQYAGTPKHSSLGTDDSAIHKMLTELSTLCSPVADSKHALPSERSQISINVGLIEGGHSANTTSPSATAHLSIRYATSTDTCINTLNEMIKEGALTYLPPLEPLTLFVPDRCRETAIEVKFASDCSVFHGHVPHVMMRGPGSIADAHTDSEKLSRKEFERAIVEVAEELGKLLNTK